MHGPALWKNVQNGQRVRPFHWADGTATSGAQGGTTKLLHVGRTKAKETHPDQGSDAEYDPLLEG